MATLAEIYHKIDQTCFKDESGVYLDGKRISLDNAIRSAYIRRNGAMTVSKKGYNMYDVTLPLKFVGCGPGLDAVKLERATIAALLGSNCDIQIQQSEITKEVIAESEGIQLEELTKFDGVAMVMIDYISFETREYDPTCDYDLC